MNRSRSVFFLGRWAAICVFFIAAGSQAASLEEARQQFISGNYAECVLACEEAIKANAYQEEWRILLANALLTLGRHTEARAAVTNLLARHSWSIRAQLTAYDVFQQSGESLRAQQLLREINQLAGARPWAYRDAPNLVALGRAALLMGADARLVLERVFDTAKKADPEYRGIFLGIGQMALEKHDYALAAKTFAAGQKKFPKDADIYYGLARSFAPDDRKQMMLMIEKALGHNPQHVPSLLLLADHLIDAEDYEAAKKILESARDVNPKHPEAWAYDAVIHHLHNDSVAEIRARQTALSVWRDNPRVDFIIGQKLSQKYRFTEGAEYQRRALVSDPDYLPAKVQLAQDLLRLGEDAEGWRLAEEVHQRDAYNVSIYNLLTLKDSMAAFRTLEGEGLILRMAPGEAQIYGERALQLLQRARSNLCEKYGIKLDKPVIVEIFPDPRDFGVRTFGMPHNPGFLGVCFGRLITANSPASQSANPANWEAVLWHEFCHVVTLQMTRNKMPRWLSEGISVYEELQENKTWGQTMTPRYRQMILEGGLTPVGNLSSAFLAPRTPLDLQFAYYQSALVVEFLIDRFGLDALKQVLNTLREGTAINAALEKHTAPIEQIEQEFDLFARERAGQLAPELDWEKPDAPEPGEDWAALHPKNFWVLTHQAKERIAAKQWEEAKAPLNKLIELFPSHIEPGNAYALLAQAHRELNEPELERSVLSKLASLSGEAPDVYLRLMELAAAGEDWAEVTLNAERFLAVNPLLPQPYRWLVQSAERTGELDAAVRASRTLLKMDVPNRAEVHFRLARLLHAQGDPAARRHVLEALEEAPRFREAHRLLLELAKAGSLAPVDPMKEEQAPQ
jgi:tetratricopeptide (TPR) repeat protein